MDLDRTHARCYRIGMNMLKRAREVRGMTQSQLAALANTSQPQIKRLENGERKLTREWADRLAPHLSVTPEELIFGPAEEHRGKVPLVGYVGAGAAFHAFDQGKLGEVDEPEDATETTVAVEIRGDSLGSIFDRWLVYYDHVELAPTRDMIGHLCVMRLSDGRTLVKKLKRGQISGMWTLLSNTEEPIYDVTLEWCARVKQMRPR